MFQANEDSIVKSLETIAKCMLKQNKMAEEAIKKSNELYKANMAMIKESQIKIEEKPVPVEFDDNYKTGVKLDLDGTK